jgi:hypothetical protein
MPALDNAPLGTTVSTGASNPLPEWREHSSEMIGSARSASLMDQFALLRMAVGYLGQRKQFGWWDCDFLDPIGLRFMETTFPRTAWPAALRSTTDAACMVHDHALGRVGNYHLFRLPPVLEDELEHAYNRMNWSQSGQQIQSPDAASDLLRRIADALIKAPAGPVQVGVERRIVTATSVRELAAHYHSAFQDGIRCFPYFAPEKDAR